jgi:hypothetical protein
MKYFGGIVFYTVFTQLLSKDKCYNKILITVLTVQCERKCFKSL